MANHITTYGGTHFTPTEPEPSDIHITDIAHALSLLCRGNGHVKTFFSVGQHCIHCALEAQARGYSERVILACLLHDAGEAYMSDVPRPLKPYIADYKVIEGKLLDTIYQKYLGSPLTEEEENLVQKVDDDMLYYDLWNLLNEPSEGPAPEMKTIFSYAVLPFEVVEQTYLNLFNTLMTNQNLTCS